MGQIMNFIDMSFIWKKVAYLVSKINNNNNKPFYWQQFFFTFCYRNYDGRSRDVTSIIYKLRVTFTDNPQHMTEAMATGVGA